MSVVVKHGMVFDGQKTYRPGEVISGLSAQDEDELISSGTAELVREGAAEDASNNVPPEMTVKELKEFLATAESIDEVRALLENELGKTPPRQSAVKVLEEWIAAKNAGVAPDGGSEADEENEEEDALPPAFNADDAIVR